MLSNLDSPSQVCSCSLIIPSLSLWGREPCASNDSHGHFRRSWERREGILPVKGVNFFILIYNCPFIVFPSTFPAQPLVFRQLWSICYSILLDSWSLIPFCETVFTVPTSDPFQSCWFFLYCGSPPFSFLMCLLFPGVLWKNFLGSIFCCWILGLIPLFLPFHLRRAGTNLQVECGEKIIQHCGEIFSILYKHHFATYTLCKESLEILT